MAEDGQDWNGLEMTILKSLANFFKMHERWRGSFKFLTSAVVARMFSSIFTKNGPNVSHACQHVQRGAPLKIAQVTTIIWGSWRGVIALTNAIWAVPCVNNNSSRKSAISPRINFWEKFLKSLKIPEILTSSLHVSRKFFQVSWSSAKSWDHGRIFFFSPKQPFLELTPPVAFKLQTYSVRTNQ